MYLRKFPQVHLAISHHSFFLSLSYIIFLQLTRYVSFSVSSTSARLFQLRIAPCRRLKLTLGACCDDFLRIIFDLSNWSCLPFSSRCCLYCEWLNFYPLIESPKSYTSHFHCLQKSKKKTLNIVTFLFKRKNRYLTMSSGFKNYLTFENDLCDILKTISMQIVFTNSKYFS